MTKKKTVSEPTPPAEEPVVDETPAEEPVVAEEPSASLEIGKVYVFRKPSGTDDPEKTHDVFLGRVQGFSTQVRIVNDENVEIDIVDIQILNSGNYSDSLKFERKGLEAREMDPSVAYNLSLNPEHYGE